MFEDFSFVLDFYSNNGLKEKVNNLFRIMLQHDGITQRTSKLLKDLNNIYKQLFYDININEEFREREIIVLGESLRKEGLKPFSRLIFNLSNLNFIDNLKNNNISIKTKEDISPFVRLSLYSLYDTKIDNNIDQDKIFDFKTLNIIINIGDITDKVKIFNTIRNALVHDQFYVFEENDKLYLHIKNKNYFEGIVELDEVFKLFDVLLDNPIDKINFEDQNQTRILADELLLNLIFNSNKDHFLTKYREEDYEKIDSSGFDTDWINVERERKPFFNRKIFKFKNEEDKQRFCNEHNLTYKTPKQYTNSFRLVKEAKFSSLRLGDEECLIDFSLMSYDRANKIHVPNFVLFTKLRNAVAHGHYEYVENEDIFVFYDRKKSQSHANFNTFIKREDLEVFLHEPIFLETLLMHEASLAAEKDKKLRDKPLYKMFLQLVNAYSRDDYIINKEYDMPTNEINNFENITKNFKNIDNIYNNYYKEESNYIKNKTK